VKKYKLIKEGTAYTLFTFFSASVPFLLLPILTNNLEPSAYGEISLFTAFLGILGAMVGVNGHSFASRSYYEEDVDDNSVLVSSGIMLIVSAVIVLLILSIFSSFWIQISGLSYLYLIIGFVTAIFHFLNEYRLSRYQVQNRVWCYGIIQILLAVLGILLTYLFIRVDWLELNGRILAISSVIIIIGFFSLVSLSLEYSGKFKYDRLVLRNLVFFGLPIVIHLLSTFFVNAYDRFLIHNYLSSHDLGIYSVAFQFSLIISVLYSALNKAVMPWMFERLSEEKVDSAREVSRFLKYGILFIFLILVY
jgi:O-antigen/teichoic acid export membrane protein